MTDLGGGGGFFYPLQRRVSSQSTAVGEELTSSFRPTPDTTSPEFRVEKAMSPADCRQIPEGSSSWGRIDSVCFGKGG